MVVFYGIGDYSEYKTEDSFCIEDLRHLPKEYDALVFFAQPDAEEIKILEAADSRKIFAYLGIRLDCKKFTTQKELRDLLGQCAHQKKDQFVKQYLTELRSPNAEEVEYLKNTYRLHPDFGIAAIGEILQNTEKTEFGGVLLTFRGDDASFQALVKCIKKDHRRNYLLMDFDLIRPSFDMIFGLHNIATKERSYFVGKDNTGLNVALELLSKKVSLDEMIQKTVRRREKSLYLLLGNYNIFNCEYYEMNAFHQLVSAMLQRFDVIIVRLGNSLYDELAMAMTHRSDMNIFAVGNNAADLRFFHQLYEMLIGRQDISEQKIAVYSTDVLYRGFLYSGIFKKAYRGSIRKLPKNIGRRKAGK